MTELQKEKVQQQMKLEEMASNPSAKRVGKSLRCEAQELQDKFVMMQEEVETTEEENRTLKSRVAELIRTIESAKNQHETEALRTQLEQQAEELAAAQKECAWERHEP